MARTNPFLQMKENTAKQTRSNDTMTDQIVDRIVAEESKPKPKPKLKPQVMSGISIQGNKKESKSIRRTFLLRPSMVEKISIVAKDNNISENELVNQILESVLK